MDKRLVTVLADVFGLRNNEIVPDLHRDNIGNWDSLKHMDLIVSLEKEFDIVLHIHDIMKMDSIKNIRDVLIAKGVNLGI